jgi:hypothetical protein
LFKTKLFSAWSGYAAIAANGQGFMQVLNLKNVRPQPLLNKDKKVKVNQQKPNRKCPAGTTAHL